MTLFIDASALVSVLLGENDGAAFAAEIEADADPLWSAMSCWETVAALQRSRGFDVARARFEVEHAAADRPFRLVSIGEAELAAALDAYQRYGKGRHRARLNMGDCFAYACARTNGARLLYKGDDFVHTDMA